MEDHYEDEIFSILSISHARTSVIMAAKRESRRHSTTSFSENVVVAGTSYKNLERAKPPSVSIPVLASLVKKSNMKFSGVSFFF